MISSTTIVILIDIAAPLIGLLIGYYIGRHTGKRTGYWKGRWEGCKAIEDMVISRGEEHGYDKQKLWEDLLQ